MRNRISPDERSNIRDQALVMMPRRWLRSCGLLAAGLGLISLITPASAQDVRPRPQRRPPLRLEVPAPQLYRECSAKLVLEHRPGGDYVVPRMHCWWAPKR
jgi:hypothetical protein